MIHHFSKSIRALCISLIVCVGATIVCLGQTGDKGVKNPQLEKIVIGMFSYSEKYRTFPPAGTMAGGGLLVPAWQVELLPFIDQAALYGRIDRKQSWDSPANKPVFSTEIPSYLGVHEKKKKGADGLALSHYAGNDHLFLPRRGLRVINITDGTSNTLSVGEVGTDFSPWARPDNTRNPINGLKGKSGQFGRKDGTGALFAMCDGTVRSLSSNIDPKVLAALSTPRSFEDIAKLQEGTSSTATPRGAKDRKKSNDDNTNTQDPRDFGRVYSSHRDQTFELVAPAEFRDEFLKTAFEARQDPNRKMIDQGTKKRDWFEFGDRMVELAKQNESQKRPLFAPAGDEKKPANSKYFCMFVEEKLDAQAPDLRASSFKLVKTRYEWTLDDLIEPFIINWSPNLLFVNTPDKRLPTLTLAGDIVIKGVRPIGDRQLAAANNVEINSLMNALEDYYAAAGKPSQKLRFRIAKRQIIEVLNDPRKLKQKSAIKEKFADAKEREAAYLEICDKLGVNPETSRVLDTRHCIDVVAAENLPAKPADAKTDPASLKEYYKTAQEEFRAKLKQANQAEFADIKFATNEKGLIEVYTE